MFEARLEAAGAAVEVSLETGCPPALDEAAASADPRHAFLRAAWFAAGAAAATTLVARRPDGRTIAALPTVASKPGVRAVPGGYWPWRSFPIAADAGDAELIAFLADPLARSLGPVWRMGPQRDDDPTGVRIARLAPEAGWVPLRRTLGRTWLLDVAKLRANGGWPRGSTLRKNRFFEKHLAAEGGTLEFRFVTGPDWTSQVFDTLAGIERRAWVGTRTDGGAAKFLAPRHRRVWEEAAADPALAAMMWGSILTVGGVPAAFGFDLDCGATRYCIANSYDPRFARHSPGRVLAYRSFEHLEARGVSLLDWGSGDPGYKEMMGAGEGPEVVDWLFVRGRAGAALLRPVWER